MKKYFQKVIYAMLILVLTAPLFAFSATPDELRRQIDGKQAEIQQLEKQIAAYKEQIKSQKNQATTLSKQILGMEAQIKKLETEIKLTQTQIDSASMKIEGLKTDINAKNTLIEKQKSFLSETIRTINEFDKETPLEMIVKNRSLSDFLNQVQFIETLQDGIKEKLDEIQKLKKQLESKKGEYEGQKQELEQLRNTLSGKNMVLSNQVDEKEDLLAKTKSQEKKYQTILTDLEKKRKDIDKEIYQMEEKLRQLIDPSSIPGAKKGLFAWPLSGLLAQGFGCLETKFAIRSYADCNGGKGGFHNGVDIDADLGDPVKAALDGTVSGVGNLGKYAYGKWVTVTHSNGLTTLYAHLSAQSVKVGQKVKTGEVIGYAGSTGYSTGPHLHFTVYSTNTFKIEQRPYGSLPVGGTLNPMNYL